MDSKQSQVRGIDASSSRGRLANSPEPPHTYDKSPKSGAEPQSNTTTARSQSCPPKSSSGPSNSAKQLNWRPKYPATYLPVPARAYKNSDRDKPKEHPKKLSLEEMTAAIRQSARRDALKDKRVREAIYRDRAQPAKHWSHHQGIQPCCRRVDVPRVMITSPDGFVRLKD